MDKIKSYFTDLKDTSADYTKEEKDAGKAMAILSYIGILCLIPYFAEKNNKYVRYHAIQGLNLLILSLIVSVASGIVAAVGTVLAFIPFIGFILTGIVYLIVTVLSVAPFVLAVMGVVYAFQDQAKELPVLNKVKIIKE